MIGACQYHPWTASSGQCTDSNHTPMQSYTHAVVHACTYALTHSYAHKLMYLCTHALTIHPCTPVQVWTPLPRAQHRRLDRPVPQARPRSSALLQPEQSDGRSTEHQVRVAQSVYAIDAIQHTPYTLYHTPCTIHHPPCTMHTMHHLLKNVHFIH
jgi:hypothetical protein